MYAAWTIRSPTRSTSGRRATRGSARPSEDPRQGAAALRATEAIRDELRRRIGATFTAGELADLYAQGTDWCLEAARWALPEVAADLDPQAIVDGAFFLQLRGATDYRGGRLVPQD